MVDDISARGQIVLNELRLLVSLSTEAPCLRSVATNMVGDSQVSEVSLVEPKQHQVYSSTSINFPRTSTQSSTKGRRIRSKSSAKSPDEKLINSRTQCNSNNFGIAKTVRRTLSGGISNIILRPFQPPQQQQHLPPAPPFVVKAQPTMSSSSATQPKTTARPPAPAPSKSKSFRSDERENHQHHQNGLRKIRRKVSSTFARAIRGNEDVKVVNSNIKAAPSRKQPPPSHSSQGHHSNKWITARESMCSRNSTISVLEYLAARRRREEETTLRDGKENLVPLSEYGRNCHLYGCDTPHMWNPDKNSSRTILHCDCDMNDLSPTHHHVEDSAIDATASVSHHHHHCHVEDADADDELSIFETQLFYRPGESVSTCILEPARDGSSVFSVLDNIDNLSRPSLSAPSFERPCNPVALSASFSSLDLRV
ncbi:hypothetical protein FRC14_007329 [Serendipita sp. 396]|nr:hypothetical protein FRC14_007329 [Serendipita sp. 396]